MTGVSPEATDQRLAEIVQRLTPMRPVRILLFGSTARGDADEWSDLDLIVVADQVAPRFLDRIADAYELIDPRYGLDILIYTPEEYAAMLEAENRLITAAEAHGRLLYARPAT